MKDPKILIRVPNWLGDTLMSTPAVSVVKKIFPKSRLSVLAKPVFSKFWKVFPGVDEVIPYGRGLENYLKTAFQLKKRKFDLALVLPTSISSAFQVFVAEIPQRIGWGGEGRDVFLTEVVPHPHPRQKHLVWEFLELVQNGLKTSAKITSEKLHWTIPKEDLNELIQIWKLKGLQPHDFPIALAPGATYGPAKRWPISYWKELIRSLLSKRNETLLILGGLEEENYLRLLLNGISQQHKTRLKYFVGQTSPTLLAATLSKCKVLVTNDTGPMHVAAAVGTPTVAIFGSTSPNWTRPFGLGHEVIYKNLECNPCFQRTCPIGYKCLHAITVGEVFKAVVNILHKPRKLKAEKPPLSAGMVE